MPAIGPIGTSALVACHECDTLHRRVPLRRHALARCTRCGALLYSPPPFSAQQLFALVLGSLLVFMIAMAFPIVGLEVQGTRVSSTLPEAIWRLWDQERPVVAVLVFATTALFPLLELSALLYLLWHLLHGRCAPGFARVVGAVQALRPWGMIEVFMLGVLVAVVKLSHMAHVIPGVALWAFGALTFLLAAVVSFDPRHLWELAEDARP